MEIFITAGVVGFIAFIAGRGLVGSTAVTKEYAEHVASTSYIAGYKEGVRYATQMVDQFGPECTQRLRDGLNES